MVVVDPVEQSCLSVAGNGSAAKGLAMERVSGIGTTEILLFNFIMMFGFLIAPRIDQKINQFLRQRHNGLPEIDFKVLKFKVESNFQQDLPTMAFIFNFALLSTLAFARWYAGG